MIITFAGGPADRMLQSYDGSDVPPRLIGGEVRTNSELARIRGDIERLWLAGHDTQAIARFTWLEQEEVEAQLEEMRGLEIYDVRRKGGFDFRGGRLVAYRSRWPKRSRSSARTGRTEPAPDGEPETSKPDPPKPGGL